MSSVPPQHSPINYAALPYQLFWTPPWKVAQSERGWPHRAFQSRKDDAPAMTEALLRLGAEQLMVLVRELQQRLRDRSG